MRLRVYACQPSHIHSSACVVVLLSGQILRGICSLPVANHATIFHIIVDNPKGAAMVEAELELMPRVRVRSNPVRRRRAVACGGVKGQDHT